MREHKYKVWDTLNNKFLEGTYGLMNTFVNSYSEGRLVFLQYAELKDKDKKEIYEGDKLQDEDGKIYEVMFIEGSFKGYTYGYCLQPCRFWICKVIGHIYEK